jgi:hypothetical protein
MARGRRQRLLLGSRFRDQRSTMTIRLPFRRPHPAIAIGYAAVGDMKGVDHAVADEPMMIAIAGRELGIGTVAVERAGEALRQCTVQR